MRGTIARDTFLQQKWGAISKTIYQNGIAVLALQETHLNQNKTRLIQEVFSKNLEIITLEDTNDPTG